MSEQAIEPSRRYPGVGFESIEHPSFSHEYQSVWVQFDAGNLRTHSSNVEANARIANRRGIVFAADGIPNRIKLSKEEKEAIWVSSLPDRPSLLNPNGEVYIVGGDFFYEQLTRNQEMENRLKLIGDTAITATATAAIGTYLTDKLLKKGFSGYEINLPVLNYRLTRQQFLRVVGSFFSIWCFNMLAGVRVQSVIGRSRASEQEQVNFYQTIATVVRPRIFPLMWTDARTARMFTTLEDGIDYLGLPKDTSGVVVAGPNHAYNQESLHESEDARRDSIVWYAEKLLESVDEIAKEYPTLAKEEVKRSIIDDLAYFEIVKVTDPGGPDFNPDLKNLIQKPGVIEHAGSIISSRITKWLEHLRPASQ